MANNKSDKFKSPAIEQRRAEIAQRKEALRREFMDEVLDPKPILSGLISGAATKFLLPSTNSSNKNNFFYNKIVRKDPSGILPLLYDAGSHPLVAGFLARTGKSWLYWQLFNLSLRLIKKAVNNIQKEEITEAEIISTKLRK